MKWNTSIWKIWKNRPFFMNKNQGKCPGSVYVYVWRTQGGKQAFCGDQLPKRIIVCFYKEDIFWKSKLFYLILTWSIPLLLSLQQQIKRVSRLWRVFTGAFELQAIYTNQQYSTKFIDQHSVQQFRGRLWLWSMELKRLRAQGLEKWSCEWPLCVIHRFTGCLFVVNRCSFSPRTLTHDMRRKSL